MKSLQAMGHRLRKVAQALGYMAKRVDPVPLRLILHLKPLARSL